MLGLPGTSDSTPGNRAPSPTWDKAAETPPAVLSLGLKGKEQQQEKPQESGTLS